MSYARRGREYRRIEAEVAGASYLELLHALQEQHEGLRRFQSWRDVLTFMHEGSSENPEKDEVLRPILQAFRAGWDRRWTVVLLAIFWPGLDSMCSKKRAWDAEQEELWQNIQCRFLESLRRESTLQRTERIVQKILNDTAHHLHDQYRRRWRHSENEVQTEVEVLDEMAVEFEFPELEALDAAADRRELLARYQRHLESEFISPFDFRLLVDTRVQGKSLADCARETKTTYQSVKKRRQRAEAFIRKMESAGQKT